MKRRAQPVPPGLRTAIEAIEAYAGWRQRYLDDWHQVPEHRMHSRPGHWARGDDGTDAWITGTPEYDRDWFAAHNMRSPLFGDLSRVYWRDYGDGLHGLSYR